MDTTRRGRRALPSTLDTPRLHLRPWTLGDVDEVFEYAQDPEWSRFLRMLPSPYTPADAERFVASQVLLDRVTHPSWAICLRGVVIGGINVRFAFDHALGELGYSVARLHWSQGYVTEAARAVIDAAFATHPDLKRIRSMADAGNLPSQRVMEKVGMRREGVLRENRIERGHPMDEVWYGLLRREWEIGRGTEHLEGL